MSPTISLDLDGTIVKPEWVDYVWNEAMPELYAEQEGISAEEARQILFRAYDEVGKEDIRWYLIPYWFKRFRIRKDCREFIAERSHRIELYDDAVEVLWLLRRAIILTNAPRELAEAEVKVIEGRAPVKLRLYSAVSDFGTLKKDPAFYRWVLEREGEFVHVGDDYSNDYLAPRLAGLKSYYLDRKREDLYSAIKNLHLV
jgi:HAD superfamily hydrolase (TIGR01549 family)